MKRKERQVVKETEFENGKQITKSLAVNQTAMKLQIFFSVFLLICLIFLSFFKRKKKIFNKKKFKQVRNSSKIKRNTLLKIIRQSSDIKIYSHHHWFTNSSRSSSCKDGNRMSQNKNAFKSMISIQMYKSQTIQ